MKRVALAITFLLMAAPAAAHPRIDATPHREPAWTAIAVSGEPKVRIRIDAAQEGLDPLSFAKWLAAHPRMAGADIAKLRRTSSRTTLLNLSSPAFSAADQDDDGRISATELADFVAPPSPPAINPQRI